MDIEKLIERLNAYSAEHQQHGGITAEAADAISTLQAENEKLRAELEQERDHRLHAEEHADLFLEDCKRLNVELEQVKNERDSAKATLHWLKLHGQKEG